MIRPPDIHAASGAPTRTGEDVGLWKTSEADLLLFLALTRNVMATQVEELQLRRARILVQEANAVREELSTSRMVRFQELGRFRPLSCTRTRIR